MGSWIKEKGIGKKGCWSKSWGREKESRGRKESKGWGAEKKRSWSKEGGRVEGCWREEIGWGKRKEENWSWKEEKRRIRKIGINCEVSFNLERKRGEKSIIEENWVDQKIRGREKEKRGSREKEEDWGRIKISSKSCRRSQAKSKDRINESIKISIRKTEKGIRTCSTIRKRKAN